MQTIVQMVKEADAGALLYSTLDPVGTMFPRALTDAQLKSIDRHAKKTGQPNPYRGYKQVLDYLRRPKQPLAGAAFSLDPRASFRHGQPSHVGIASMLSPTTFHEVGHGIDHAIKPEGFFGDRGVFGFGGNAGTALPSEASATKHGLKLINQAGASTAVRRHAGMNLAAAYDTYATGARQNPGGSMLKFINTGEDLVTDLQLKLSEGFRENPGSRLNSLNVAEEYARRLRQRFPEKYPVLSPENLGGDPLKDRLRDVFSKRDDFDFYGTLRNRTKYIGPKGVSFNRVDSMLRPVTDAGLVSGLRIRMSQGHKDALELKEINQTRQQAANNRRVLVRNLSNITPDEQVVARKEIRDYLKQTGDTFGRDAKRGTIEEFKRLRNEAKTYAARRATIQERIKQRAILRSTSPAAKKLKSLKGTVAGLLKRLVRR